MNEGINISYEKTGHPSEETLDAIRRWKGDSDVLFKVIERIFTEIGNCELRDGICHVATGGWPGGKSVINALEDNRMFWYKHWLMSRRGGFYEFMTKEVKNND